MIGFNSMHSMYYNNSLSEHSVFLFPCKAMLPFTLNFLFLFARTRNQEFFLTSNFFPLHSVMSLLSMFTSHQQNASQCHQHIASRVSFCFEVIHLLFQILSSRVRGGSSSGEHVFFCGDSRKFSCK